MNDIIKNILSNWGNGQFKEENYDNFIRQISSIDLNTIEPEYAEKIRDILSKTKEENLNLPVQNNKNQENEVINDSASEILAESIEVPASNAELLAENKEEHIEKPPRKKMPLSKNKKILLKVLLGAVGGIALMTIIFVLLGTNDYWGKVATTILYIGFFGVLSSFAIDYFEKTDYKKHASFLLMWIILKSCMSISALWSSGILNNLFDKINVSMYVFITAIVYSVVLETSNVKSSKAKMMLLMNNILVATISIVTAGFIIAGEYEGVSSLWETIVYILFFGFLTKIAIKYYEKTQYKNHAMAFLFWVSIKFSLSILSLWSLGLLDDIFVRLNYSMYLVLMGVIYSLILEMCNFISAKAKLSVKISNYFIIITCIMAVINYTFQIENDFYTRLNAVFFILIAFMTIATPIINKVYKTPAEEEAEAQRNLTMQQTQTKKSNNSVVPVLIACALILLFGQYFLAFFFKIIDNILDEFIFSQFSQPAIVENYQDSNNSYYSKPITTVSNDNSINANICNGQVITLSQDMIVSMTNSWTAPNKSFLSNGELVIVDDTKIIIKTTGCKKMSGTIVYNDYETNEKPNVLVSFHKEEVAACGYSCPNLIEEFTLIHDKSQNFEIDINGTNQIVIQKIASPYYPVTIEIENIYFK